MVPKRKIVEDEEWIEDEDEEPWYVVDEEDWSDDESMWEPAL